MAMYSEKGKVLDVIRNAILDVSTKEIHQSSDLAYSTVQKHVKQLEREGEIIKTREIQNAKMYAITTDMGKMPDVFREHHTRFSGSEGVGNVNKPDNPIKQG